MSGCLSAEKRTPPPALKSSPSPNTAQRRRVTHNVSSTDDLIADLLDKGQRLREAMTVSAIDAVCEVNVADDSGKSAFPVSRRILGNLSNKDLQMDRRHTKSAEQKTVDLLLGSPTSSRRPVCYVTSDDEEQATGNCSMSSEDLELSDPDDPVYDQQLLDLLFYNKNPSIQATQTGDVNVKPVQQAVPSQQSTGVASAISDRVDRAPVDTCQPDVVRPPSLEDPGNSRPPSRTRSASPRVEDSACSLNDYQSDSCASHVSFYMTPSDDEDGRTAAEGLSVEQLTLLARVSVARVHIDKLVLKERPSTPVQTKTYKGRPPPAKPSKYGTYFVEYQFPVMAASREQGEKTTSATETVRAVSKKVEKSGNVTWNHHMVFPVYFTGHEVEKWWNSMLIIKVHHRSKDSKTASLIGSCSVQMKDILKSLSFGVDLELSVTKHHKSANQKKRRRRRADLIGLLKMSIQLDSDSPSFSTALRELQISKAQKQNPLLRARPDTPPVVPSKPVQVKPSQPVKHHLNTKSEDHVCNKARQPDTVLYVLLQVGDARKLRSQRSARLDIGGTTSSYAVCRLFWCSDKIRSDVCWNSAQPNYRINETYPVQMTEEILTKMSNNYMVIEFWEKRSAEKDQLLGYTKLPLNSFYMSYKDEGVASVLSKSQYPVIAVDSYLPLHNPLTGSTAGEVKVLLAMGTQEQVMSLDTLKVITGVTDETQRHEKPQQRTANHVPAERDGHPIADDCQVTEHRFDMKIVGVRNYLSSDETDMYLGEADCFIQYHFPSQAPPTNSSDLAADQQVISVKTHRTQTTLCTDCVTFDDLMSHVFRLPTQDNLQHVIANAFGKTYGAAVPFEFWCRFYHPNTRDQLMSKCLLPLSKLLALVTMSSGQQVACQSFSLPLLPTSEEQSSQASNGVMDLSVRYSRRVVPSYTYKSAFSHQMALSAPVSRNPYNPSCNIGHVTLSVTIEQITGLKSSALALSRKHPCLDYYSAVGVNLYTRQYLSFLPGSEGVKVSDTEVRVLHLQEWMYRTQYMLPLLLDHSTSLAEAASCGSLIVEVWHQSVRDDVLEGCSGVPTSSDIMLGIVSVPLRKLLTHKSGIRNWFPIGPPADLYTVTGSSDPMMGALLVQMRFNNSNDISIIVDSASKVGYQLTDSSGVNHTDVVYDELTEFNIEVDWFTFPAYHVMRSEEDCLPLTAFCYLKVNFYSNDSAYSLPLRLTDKGDNFEGRCEVKFKFLQTVNTSLLWYLFDKDLEIDLWFTRRNLDMGCAVTPSTQDKYLGTAYISLELLSKHSQSTLSDVYPIYRPATDRLGRAMLQAHIRRRPHQEAEAVAMKTQRKVRLDVSDVTNPDDLDSTNQSDCADLPDEDCLEAMISIEEGNRLTTSAGREGMLLMTYSLAGKEHKTHSVDVCQKPVWMYEKCVKLSLSSIRQAKHLVLKLWNKSDQSGSQVIGFTTIDLRPLLSGMPKLHGWYNIVDFTGLCQGQIKCGVEPLTPVTKWDVSSSTLNTRVGSPASQTDGKSLALEERRYTTHGQYADFPGHVTRFTEQRVQYSGVSYCRGTSAAELLKKQLAELDSITENLRKRLHTNHHQSIPASSQSEKANKSCDPHDTHVSQSSFELPPLQTKPVQSSSRLLDTVRQVHDNVRELVNHGVIQSDLSLLPPPPIMSQKELSSQSDRCSESIPTQSRDVTYSRRESQSSSTSELTATLRTQLTYSVTSDDEGGSPFSPPVHLPSRGLQPVELIRHSPSMSPAGRDDWLSDGVEPIPLSEDEQAEDEQAEGSVEQAIREQQSEPVGHRLEGYQSEGSDEDSEPPLDTSADDESGNEYDSEVAVSRTINDVVTSSGLPVEMMSSHGAEQASSKDTLDDIADITELDSGLATTATGGGPVRYDHLQSASDDKAFVNAEDVESEATCPDEVIPEATAADEASDRAQVDPEATAAAESDAEVVEGDPNDYVKVIAGKDWSPDVSSIHAEEAVIVLPDQLALQSVSNPSASVQQSTAGELRLPSFFPSKEELEVKLKRALEARRSPVESRSRFERRPPAVDALRQAENLDSRMKQLKDIFNTKYNRYQQHS